MGPESTKLNISSRKIDITVTPDRFQALPRLQTAFQDLQMTQIFLKLFVSTCTTTGATTSRQDDDEWGSDSPQ